MDESELITAARLAARISQSHPDYTNARLRQELTDAVQTLFVEPIKRAGNGYAQQLYEQSITSGTEVYPIFHRAVVQGLVSVWVKLPSGDIREIVPIDEEDLIATAGNSGEPRGYLDQSDHLRLAPNPTVTGWTLQQYYKLRPSKIVEKQTAGLISSVDAANLQVVVNTIPVDRSTALSIVSGTTLVDVVSPKGSHDLHLVGSAQTYTGTTITFPVGTDMSRIQVGDYVRAEMESEWPQLPQEFHRTLADAVGAVILTDMGAANKAANLAGKVQSDIGRMTEMMEPRVRDQARPIVPRHGVLRSRLMWSPPAKL